MLLSFPYCRIKVTRSNKIYKPGSIGYAYYIDGFTAGPNDLSNTTRTHMIFTQYGKSGKRRLNHQLVTTEVINYKEQYADIFDIIKNAKLFQKADYDIKHEIMAGREHIVKTEPIPPISKNLLSLSVEDFITHISVMSSLLNTIIHNKIKIDRKSNVFIHSKAIRGIIQAGRFSMGFSGNHKEPGLHIIPAKSFGSLMIYLHHNKCGKSGNDDDNSNVAINIIQKYFENNRNRKRVLDILHIKLSELRIPIIWYINEYEKRQRNSRNYINKRLCYVASLNPAHVVKHDPELKNDIKSIIKRAQDYLLDHKDEVGRDLGLRITKNIFKSKPKSNSYKNGGYVNPSTFITVGDSYATTTSTSTYV